MYTSLSRARSLFLSLCIFQHTTKLQYQQYCAYDRGSAPVHSKPNLSSISTLSWLITPDRLAIRCTAHQFVRYRSFCAVLTSQSAASLPATPSMNCSSSAYHLSHSARSPSNSNCSSSSCATCDSLRSPLEKSERCLRHHRANPLSSESLNPQCASPCSCVYEASSMSLFCHSAGRSEERPCCRAGSNSSSVVSLHAWMLG